MKERIGKWMEQEKTEALLVSSPAMMTYLTGFTGEGILFITPERWTIFTDSRYTLQGEEETKGCEILEVTKPYGVLLGERYPKGFETVGFEDRDLSVERFRKLAEHMPVKEWRGLGGKLSALRQIKTPEEIEKMRRAEHVGDMAFAKILHDLKPGMTELAVAARLEYTMKMVGASCVSFPTIVASGIHSAMPHAVPTQKKLEPGDFVTMDFGCKIDGYCSDMTRTVVIGQASEEQKKIYDIVRKAQEAALEVLKPGITGAKVDAVARDYIAKAGYGGCFGHGLGHSVGLEIHEEPRLSPSCQEVLLPSTIMTVEPGIYVPGMGGVRIEDMVVLTEDGYENLTKSPKVLMELAGS